MLLDVVVCVLAGVLGVGKGEDPGEDAERGTPV